MRRKKITLLQILKKHLSKYEIKTFPRLKSLWCCSAAEKLRVSSPLLPWEWGEDTADNKAIHRLDINSRNRRNQRERCSCKELSPLFTSCYKEAGRNEQKKFVCQNKNILPFNTYVLFHFNYHTCCCGPLIPSWKPQNSWSWKGLLEDAYSNTPAQRHVNNSKLLRSVSSWVLSYCQG